MAMAIASGYFTDLIKLQGWIAEAVEHSQEMQRPILLSVCQTGPQHDPLQFFARANRLGLDAFFWERADDNFSLAAAGTAADFSATGPDRFATIERDWQELVAGALIHREGITADGWGLGPALLGGFRFDAARPAQTERWQDYEDGRLRLPRLQMVRREDGSFVTLNLLVTDETDAAIQAEELSRLCAQLTEPQLFSASETAQLVERRDVKPAAAWQDLVGQAVEQIKAGAFQKVVLAREVRIEADRNLDPTTALERLRRSYASATLFAVASAGRCFLGATPERLVRLYEGEVRTIGLAGTWPRGRDEEEDRRLGAELLNSAKNQEEHAIVVRMLRTALEKVCSYVWAEDRPHLLKLSNVQHLYTPVLGRLEKDSKATLLRLVELLHPTPALGGFPRTEALTWLRENEDLDRGWYAAPVGWVDYRGEGEFVVAIRSALLEGQAATLYAGCGIVADSDPASEYAESCLKLKPMLSALGF